MLCTEYFELTSVEKVKFIGELIHACQSNTSLYKTGKNIIEVAKENGIFDGVEILPPKDIDSQIN